MRRDSGTQPTVIPQFKAAEVSMRMRAAEFLSADPYHLLFAVSAFFHVVLLSLLPSKTSFSTVPFMGVRSIPMNNLLVPTAADRDTLADIVGIAAQSRPVEAVDGNHDEAEKRNDKAR